MYEINLARNSAAGFNSLSALFQCHTAPHHLAFLIYNWSRILSAYASDWQYSGRPKCLQQSRQIHTDRTPAKHQKSPSNHHSVTSVISSSASWELPALCTRKPLPEGGPQGCFPAALPYWCSALGAGSTDGCLAHASCPTEGF